LFKLFFPLANFNAVAIGPGRPRTAWRKTIQQDLKSNNLSLNEAIDVAQNRPLWGLFIRSVLRSPSGAC